MILGVIYTDRGRVRLPSNYAVHDHLSKQQYTTGGITIKGALLALHCAASAAAMDQYAIAILDVILVNNRNTKLV